ncbi:hypothetical protein QRX50_07240 [Amycolatopsis carbonis]|uniref:Uncharacterized protein n=1 Tax=Amycolatopsis carbonis TaxID=715471 RepID=A0A9Y2II68_9PSEU|nr:hypothetical protein [Amycolatopsis sp. 2-15]WIX80557.1 hypothetical protein QRX50_07240 [Amycolatopsis sp. 2-15]
MQPSKFAFASAAGRRRVQPEAILAVVQVRGHRLVAVELERAFDSHLGRASAAGSFADQVVQPLPGSACAREETGVGQLVEGVFG